MPEIFVYCKTCSKKVKAVVLTVHDKEYDDSIQGYRRYGMVKITAFTFLAHVLQ